MSGAGLPVRVLRSFLFVPGNRPERFNKAAEAGADALILDLEDAVPLQDKAAARQAVASWLAARPAAGGRRPQILVRLNASDTVYFDADVAAVALPGLDGVVLPKAQTLQELATLAQRLGPQVALLPLIETVEGMAQAALLAKAPQVQRLVFGTIDFQLEMGIENVGDLNEPELLFFRSQLVWWSRLAGIQPPVDGVTTVLDDAQRLAADSVRARGLGFGGKLCIHPKQVAPVNAAWWPDEAQQAWARRVVAAAASANGAAVALDGKMVDRPVILKAEQILAAVA